MFFGLVTKHACDGRTDGRTDRINTPKTALSIARAVIKTVSGKVVAPLIPFEWYQYIGRSSSVPLISERKGTTPNGSTCVAHTSPHSALVGKLPATTGKTVWNWRRAVLSADAGLLVKKWNTFS